MADNFPLTPGTGRSVATDQVTYSGDTADVQLIRVVSTTGTEGSRTVIDKPVFQAEDTAHADGDLGVLMMGVRNHLTGSTTDGDYAAISVSSTGEMQTLARRDLQRISVGVTGVTTATTSYSAGDQVGTLISLSNAARVTGGGGTIVGVTLIDPSDIIGAYDVVFFDTTVTLASDNAAFAISDTDALEVVGIVQLAGAFDIGNNRVAQSWSMALPYTCTSTTLYAALLCRVGHTFFTAGALPQLVVYVERN